MSWDRNSNVKEACALFPALVAAGNVSQQSKHSCLYLHCGPSVYMAYLVFDEIGSLAAKPFRVPHVLSHSRSLLRDNTPNVLAELSRAERISQYA